MNLQQLLSEYGCNIDNFININTLTSIINRFNSSLNIKNINYLSCKDDTGIFVLVTDKYVIKIYSNDRYLKILNIYSVIKSNNIERIYQYDDYHNVTINELLIPLFKYERKQIQTNIIYNNEIVKKLLLDVSYALQQLHINNIVHGDATPDNVGFRYSESEFVLFDFGESNVVGSTGTNNYKDDVNRFLDSLLITYKDFFTKYIDKLNKIKKLVNTNDYYIEKFTNSINSVFN